MKQQIISSILVLIGALLFNVLFWNEELGINTAIFTFFIMGSLYFLYEESRSEKSVRITMLGTLLLSILVVLNNSVFSKVIFSLSFATTVGLVQEREIRFLVVSFMSYCFNLLEVPKHIIKELSKLPLLRGLGQATQKFSLVIIPILVVPIFYFIYYGANDKFAKLADGFWEGFFKIFAFDWDLSRVLFFILGLFITGAAIWKHTLIDFKKYENLFPFQLNAEKYALDTPESLEKTGRAYKSGLILIMSLNALLLINNALDFVYVWWNSSILKTPQELKSYVHEGTYLLIYGILLAIGVVLWLFRGSLNFFKTDGILRGAIYAWLTQNAILALSVGVRNWQYIDYYGLAYKRIGVFIFLTLVLLGLWILFQKVQHKRSGFYFLSQGAWAIYGVFILVACVNWDIFITRYNLNAPVKSQFLDVDFLINDVSAKNLYLIYQNKDKILSKIPNDSSDYSTENYRTIRNKTDFEQHLETKKNFFKSSQAGLSWLSWNYPDYINNRFLKENNL